MILTSLLWLGSYHPGVDYCPITAHPVIFYLIFSVILERLLQYSTPIKCQTVYFLFKNYLFKGSVFGHKRAALYQYTLGYRQRDTITIFITWAIGLLTQSPYKIVLGPQTEHGQVEVEDAQVEGPRSDIWVINHTLHRTNAIKSQVDQQAKSAGAQLHQHVSL